MNNQGDAPESSQRETQTQQPNTHHPARRNINMSRLESALERLRAGRPLRIQDAMILDYADMLRIIRLRDYTNELNQQKEIEEIMKYIKPEKFEGVAKQNPEDKEACCICLKDYDDGEEIGKLNYCVHRFHIECIIKWLIKKNQCPMCKTTDSGASNSG